MVIWPGEELCMTGAFGREKLLDFGIIIVQPVSVLYGGAVSWRSVFNCCHRCSRSVSWTWTGSSSFSYLAWSLSSDSIVVASSLLVSSVFIYAPLFLTGLILSPTLVQTSLWSVVQSAVGMTPVPSMSRRSFWRIRT